MIREASSRYPCDEPEQVLLGPIKGAGDLIERGFLTGSEVRPVAEVPRLEPLLSIGRPGADLVGHSLRVVDAGEREELMPQLKGFR